MTKMGNLEICNRLKIDEKGILLFENIPVIMLPRRLMVQLQRAIEKSLGPVGAMMVLYHAGMEMGLAYAKIQSERFGVGGLEVAQKYLETIKIMGWMQGYEISEVSEKPFKAVIRVYGSLAEEFEKEDHPICYIYQGGLGGLFQYILKAQGRDVKLIVEETKCKAMGNYCCEFVVREQVPFKS